MKKEKKVEQQEENVILDTTKKEKKPKFKLPYLGYSARIGIFLCLFVILMAMSFVFFGSAIKVEEAKVSRYQETGVLDYKVYLKPNDFYESEYLDKNMFYIASLIKNVTIDLNYQFVMDVPVDMNFSYDIVGKLAITAPEGSNTLYEKEYVLKSGQRSAVQNQNIHNIKDTLVVDYDYYNELANRFQSTYGISGNSQFTIYVRINKDIKSEENNINVMDSNQMSLSIPLSQRTLEIKMNDTGINNSQSIVNQEEEISFKNIAAGIFCFVVFVGAVASLLKLLELLMMMAPKESKYDKLIKKILNEYDRLIVETPTDLRMDNKEIIKIKRFEELLDARDNLKRPIMYHVVIPHQKANFYIEKDTTIYLLTMKAADIEDDNKKSNKNK